MSIVALSQGLFFDAFDYLSSRAGLSNSLLNYVLQYYAPPQTQNVIAQTTFYYTSGHQPSVSFLYESLIREFEALDVLRKKYGLQRTVSELIDNFAKTTFSTPPFSLSINLRVDCKKIVKELFKRPEKEFAQVPEMRVYLMLQARGLVPKTSELLKEPRDELSHSENPNIE